MAYVLGFFAADGYMIKRKRSGACYVDFYSNDRDILEKIKTVTCGSQKINERKHPNGKISYRLQFGGAAWYDNVAKLGFTQAKSKTMRLPDVPNKFVADFVRGYFDGDGCVSFGFYAHNRGKIKYPTITVRFTSGSRWFLMDLRGKLEKFVQGGYIYTKTSKDRSSGFELVFSKRDSLALFNLMYHNTVADIYLERKYDIFKKALGSFAGVA